jgi:activator of HSP90 ATPase
MKEAFELREVFSAEPSEIYHAWLDTELHGQMTGGEADCSNQVGDAFSAWDGYISGTNRELIENQKIVQSWRTSEFAGNDDDSLLTLELNKIPEGTEVILTHTHIPAGQTGYKKGWIDHYFTPMKAFFQK